MSTHIRAALAAEPVEEVPSERILSIAKAVQECAFTHESDARLIGNVCAEDVADLCDAVLDRWCRPPPPPAAPEPGEQPVSQPYKLPPPMNTPTPADRMALAMCVWRPVTCPTPCTLCQAQSAAVAHEIARQLRERHGGSSQVADWLDGVGCQPRTVQTVQQRPPSKPT